MGINIADNFAYNGKKPMDNRTEYTTLAAMKSVVDANINEGCMCYNKEDGKYYTFKSTNTVDATTGKWREFETGGGGQTYNDFTGATSSTAGAHGLVPAPSAGDEGKVLFGNGAWGALPSVDLSMLSNEAFQFSTTEKVVGTTKSGKLLYAKTVDFGALPNTTTKIVNHSIANIDNDDDKMFWAYATNPTTGATVSIPYINMDGKKITIYVNETKIEISTDSNLSAYTNTKVVIFYAKTTDSPLPSGVKFAGVTSTGEVILMKEVTLGNLPNNSTKQVAHGITNIGRIWLGEAYGITASKISVPLPFMNVQGNQYNIQIYVDSTNVNIVTTSDNSGYSGYATVYFTLAS